MTTLSDFSLQTDLPGLNAFITGTSVFELEQALRDGRVDRASFPLYGSNHRRSGQKLIRELIHDLLIFTLVEDIDLTFRSIEDVQRSLDLERKERRVLNVCLFSGGTDSYSGLLVARDYLSDVEAVFCAHVDQSKTISIVSDLERRVFLPKGISIQKVHVPPIEARGYAQLRGFLYILTAASVAHKLRSKSVIVTECGPTMYQPRFSPLDSVTMTTNPFVVRTAVKVASLLLGRRLKVIAPFEDFTKAEVIAISPEKNGLKYTHSCISQRFGTHDGTCYGCVIRRLATIAAGVRDVGYRRNPIADPDAQSGNLYSLLQFCYDCLTRFDEMKEYEIGIITTYRKKDLFRRFALDNFAAIHRLLNEKKTVVRPIRNMYESLKQHVGAEVLDQRLGELAQPTFRPNFKKTIG
jgi:7-cyano-7-deazaguanine synthase in queuosine biosynthesis